MRDVLVYKESHPAAGFETACKAAGLHPKRGFKWREDANRTLKPDLGAREWFNRWMRIDRRARVESPPPTGSFIEFAEAYLNVETFNPTSGKRQRVGQTHAFQREFCEALDSDQMLLAVILPVRHGKTAKMEQFVVKTLAENPNASILWVSSNQNHLKERSYAIQRILTDSDLYPELHETYGAWIGKPQNATSKPWTATKFYVAGRTSPERAPSFAGYGVTAKTYGARADVIILDDVDDPGFHDDQRTTILRKINGDLMSRLNEGGKIIYIGTRCGVNDVASRLMENPRWKVIVRSGENEDGSPACPEMYSAEDLAVMRESMTNELYSMMVLNDPAPAGSSMFPPSLIDIAKGSFDLCEAPTDWPRTLSMDPAAAGRAAAIVTAHDPRSGEIRVVDLAVIEKGGWSGMFEMVQSLVYRNRPKAAVIEATGGSTYFHETGDAERFLYNEGVETIVPFKTHTQTKDDLVGITKAYFDRGKLRIAYGTVLAQERMRPLIDDLIAFQPTFKGRRRYDTVMALGFAVHTIAKNASQLTGSYREVADPLAMRYSRRRIA